MKFKVRTSPPPTIELRQNISAPPPALIQMTIKPLTGTITHMAGDFMRIEFDFPVGGYIVQPIPYSPPMPKRGDKVILTTSLL